MHAAIVGAVGDPARNLTPEATSLAAQNAFRFLGRGLAHYVVVVATVASALFTLTTAVWTWRTPMPRRRLLAFVALVGFGTITLNWTTGEWAVQPANLLFFGGAITRAGFAGPWGLTCGLPLGACIALWRRAEHLRPVRVGRAADAPPAAAGVDRPSPTRS